MAKTGIKSIHQGFDFLGFNIKRYPYHYRLNNKKRGKQQETVLVIKPSKKSMDKVWKKIKGLITPGKPMESLIRDLNPILRGWSNYFNISYHSQMSFKKLGHKV